jgi:hypothetical protein
MTLSGQSRVRNERSKLMRTHKRLVTSLLCSVMIAAPLTLRAQPAVRAGILGCACSLAGDSALDDPVN